MFTVWTPPAQFVDDDDDDDAVSANHARYAQELVHLRMEVRRLRAENKSMAETIHSLQMQFIQINLAWTKYFQRTKRTKERQTAAVCAIQ